MEKFLICKKPSNRCSFQPSRPVIPVENSAVAQHQLHSACAIAIPDISKPGENIKQVALKTYPKNADGRRVQSDWFKRFKWLEYSQSLDAVFCYACRQFQPHGSKENVFTEKGFRNWKAALDKTKAGFIKHAASASHIVAMSMWTERQNRQLMVKSVSTILNEDVLGRNRYYVTSIAEIIQFLAINELPLRGTYSIEDHEEQSLFRNLFEFTMKKDKKLAECYKQIPKNASYLSPEIQNDIIEIMADIVRESIIDDVKNADVPWFSLLEDGTRDKNNRENIAIGIRYVKNGNVFESILRIATMTTFDAHSFADLTLNILRDSGLDTSNLLSQCYDGASVMSGKNRGVQAIIQQKLERQIPYVHCFNHRLHLVIIKAVNVIPLLKQYFDQCCMLYNFLSRGKVANLYEGQALSLLLEQRWSGQLDTTKLIYKNYRQITETLKLVQSGNFDGEDIAKSVGLLSVIEKRQFRFCLVLAKKILEIIKPADKILQAYDTNLTEAITVIKAVTETITSLRNSEGFEEILQDSNALISIESEGNEKLDETPKRQTRKRKLNTLLEDFIVTERLGERSDNEEEALSALFYETIDVLVMELNRRFQDNNDLLDAMTAAENLEFDKLYHLRNLGISLPSKEELCVAKSYLKKLRCPNTFKEVFKQRTAYEDMYKLLATVRTFACSTAVCESTFSVLTRINRPQRLSMNHERLAHLVFLAFEKNAQQI